MVRRVNLILRLEESSLSVPFIYYLSLGSNALPPLIGFYRRKELHAETRVMFVFMTISLCITMIGYILAELKISNLWLSNIFFLFEYAFLTWIISYWIHSKKIKMLVLLTIPLILCMWVLAKLLMKDFLKFDNYFSSIEKLFLIIIACYVLFQLHKSSETSLIRTVSLWILAGVLITCAGNLLIFALFNTFIYIPLEDFTKVYSLHWSSNILMNVCYSLGFLCLRRP